MNEEKNLIQDSLAGDSRSFERLVEKYQAMICAITFAATGRLETSEELAQETFLRAWKNLAQLKEIDKFRFWLCSIARNLLRTYYQQKQSEKVSICDTNTLETLATQYVQSPEDTLISQEEEMILSQALMQIPEEYREPLVLYYRQQQSTKEVAESLDLNEATVRTRLSRGRQMLKDQVATMVERTLEKTGPSKKFTKAVMVSIGAGLAAGTAATAGVAAAGAAASVSTTATGILTATVVKATAIAAAVILTAGVAIYSYSKSQENNPDAQSTQQEYAIETHPQAPLPLQVPAVKEEIEPKPITEPSPTKPVVSEKQPETPPQTLKVRHPDWPGIDEPVKYVYVEWKTVLQNNREGLEKIWFRVPDGFRYEPSEGQTIIDNGQQRLVLDPNTKQAQLEPTWFVNGNFYLYGSPQPLNKHPAFPPIEFFRGTESKPDIELTKLIKESNALLDVYLCKNTSLTDPNAITAKMWVDKRTCLLEKDEGIYLKPLHLNDVRKSTTITFNYTPFSDDIFSTVIPADYMPLPIKQKKMYSGQVIDLLGNPVADAEVYLNHRAGKASCVTEDQILYKGVSDNNGNFTIALSPGTQGFIETISVWATLPDNPNFIAWTLLLNPRDKDRIDRSKLADKIPGNPGIVYPSEDYLEMNPQNGIRTGMWCAGASDIVLVMEPAGMIHGFVTDVNNLPIPATIINIGFFLRDRLENFCWTSDYNWTCVTTDNNGYFEISPLPKLWEKCLFRFSASAEGFVTDTTEELKLTAPLEKETIHFQLLRQKAIVRGILTDNYDIPLGGRKVSAKVNGKAYPSCWAITDPNGIFSIENCPNIAGLQIFAELWVNESGYYNSKKYGKFNFYPNITADVECHGEQKEYEVKLVAIKPEIEIEALLTDSGGNPLPYFPVEIRTEEGMPFEWWEECGFEKRADEYGQVVFLNVPQMKGLRLTCYPASERKSDADQAPQMQEYLKELSKAYEKYHFTEAIVPLIPGQKKYQMTIIIPTEEEYKQQNELEKAAQNSEFN
jgi:RNA polymerase sigma factor (sigma-70 family)